MSKTTNPVHLPCSPSVLNKIIHFLNLVRCEQLWSRAFKYDTSLLNYLKRAGFKRLFSGETSKNQGVGVGVRKQ